MEKKLVLLGIIAFTVIVLASCNKEFNNTQQQLQTPVLPEQSYDYVKINEDLKDFRLPERIPSLSEPGEFIFIDNCFNCDVIPFNNEVTSNEIATLGRVLFYDTNLSLNKSISCASCHKQELAFADDAALSPGFAGKPTVRNSMSLANPILNNNFFWDSRTSTLNSLISEPIENHIELGFLDMSDLVTRLQDVEFYDELFMRAYGSPNVTEERINESIAQFVGSMFSGTAKFDRAKSNDFAEYTEMEKLGMAVFFSERANCSSCHSGANFNAPDQPGGGYSSPAVAGTANVGLELNYEDQGRSNGKFKIPSLRNIALTAPYMHDGRFTNLRQVLEHYDKGIMPHSFLDHNLKDGSNPRRMNFTELEFMALEAFLTTLTDEDLVSNDKYSNPFR